MDMGPLFLLPFFGFCCNLIKYSLRHLTMVVTSSGKSKGASQATQSEDSNQDDQWSGQSFAVVPFAVVFDRSAYCGICTASDGCQSQRGLRANWQDDFLGFQRRFAGIMSGVGGRVRRRESRRWGFRWKCAWHVTGRGRKVSWISRRKLGS